MSKRQIVKSLRQEIRNLNHVIDRKIISGIPYFRESRRHKFLTSQLKRIAPRVGWVQRTAGLMALFIF